MGKNLNDCFFFTFYCQKHSIHKIDLAICKKMIHFTAFFKNKQNET